MAHILSGTTVLRVNMQGAETKPCEKRKDQDKTSRDTGLFSIQSPI